MLYTYGFLCSNSESKALWLDRDKADRRVSKLEERFPLNHIEFDMSSSRLICYFYRPLKDSIVYVDESNEYGDFVKALHDPKEEPAESFNDGIPW